MYSCGVIAMNPNMYTPLANVRSTQDQGLTLLHFSDHREHSLSHVVGCFAGFSYKSASG
jgi:hypothetical protein